MATVADIRLLPEDDDDPYSIRTGTSTVADGLRVLKHADTFAVFDRGGDIPARAGATHGLFHAGTRFLSRFGLLLGGQPLLLLCSGVSDNNVLTIDLTNADLCLENQHECAHGTIHVLRTKFLWNGMCHERLQITNFSMRSFAFDLSIHYGADFVDLFEVRGMVRPQRGTLAAPEIERDAVLLAYQGLDDVRRSTRIEFTPTPTELKPRSAVFRMHLEAKEAKYIDVMLACHVAEVHSRPCPTFERCLGEAIESVTRYRHEVCDVRSSNARFDAWIHRAHSDMGLMITKTPHGPFPYAGIPWFSTAFGRDGILTAYMMLWIDSTIAAGVLRYLADLQSDAVDESRDAEPGKILHEVRAGEMAALGEIPFGRYYGSVDSTPLFVMLLGAYWDTTADLGIVRELWPHVLRALEWIERWGDHDFDGFVEYGRRSHDGLVQQGWKDSHDSVFHADGSMAEGPIALCEVQGYVYAAWRAAARLGRALGDDRAAGWDERAEDLRVRFDDAFWCDELASYALALDGRKHPCRVRTSNAGHTLFTGIALPHRASALAETLLADDMFSGWGVRTLSTRERRYNPVAYHNGSVWPHDNALIALGMGLYGCKSHAARILEGMFEASHWLELKRMPELFCGFPRRSGEGPTLYPVACAPQAWAAASPFGLLGSLLGLTVQGDPPSIRFVRPVLPPSLEEVVLANLRAGPHRTTVRLHRYPDDVGVNVSERTGPIEIVVVK